MSNLLIMVGMLFFAFSVIGFAEGSLRYLETKMKDPFINWINVIPQVHRIHSMNQVLNSINSPEIKEKYHLVNAIGYNRFQHNFYDYHDIQQFYKSGRLDTEKVARFSARTMDVEDPVIDEIFDSKNHVRGEPYEDFMDVGLIVTEQFLNKLNYPLNTPYVWMDFLADRDADSNDINVAIPIPVNAVVKSLPGMTAFASTSYFYQQRNLQFGNNPFNPLYDSRLVLSYHGSREKADALIADIEIVFSQLAENAVAIQNVWYEQRYRVAGESFYMVYVTFSGRQPNMSFMDNAFSQLYNHAKLASYLNDLYRLYDYETSLRRFRPADEYDRISLNFSNLDKLREFSVLLEDEYGLIVDMAQIESRENYHFVSRLTTIISLVLIGFSILSILLFVSYLLKRHLHGIKRNLGTFKAFGLSNGFLINIYVKIVLAMLGLATLFALLISALFGYSGGMRLVLWISGTGFEAGNYFSLWSYYLLVALVLLTLFSVMILRSVSGSILNHTPGDLIYERE